MWRVVYIAPNRGTGDRVRATLEKDGFLVRMRAAGFEGEGFLSFELLVPESEVEDAHDAIAQMLVSRTTRNNQSKP